ncbi:hypothetical protein [Pseudonocardia alni]|uniref:hypothetical protein n=1 Tax=Pseudonocardia alni TaxID=33907 RepID=UPI003334154E
MTSQRQPATFRKRYEEHDDGLRFQEGTYTGNHPELEPVRDGILGDKVMRSRAKTGVLEKVGKDDVLRDQFTLDEMNDLNNYLAWNIWDVLVMRATEGVSGMIPRQEYEILSMLHMFYRYPEILGMITDEVGGAQGVLDLGSVACGELASQLNPLHDWCIGSCGFAMGRTGLMALEAIKSDEYVAESNTTLKFMQRQKWAKRGDGLLFNAQDRYRGRIHHQSVIDAVTAKVESFEPGDPRHAAFTQFNAAAELLAFLVHYDCRLGFSDTGPYELPDGKLLIIRDMFVNEPAFLWSQACDDAQLPHAYSLALVLDPDVMGLEEIRVNDIATSFTRPKNYLEAVVGGAVFVRDRWDTPMGEIYSVDQTELAGHLERIRSATIKLYTTISKTTRRDLVWGGHDVYYVGFLLPYLRHTGTYEKACRDYDLWEVDQRVANYYYEINKRGFAQETMPNKIFSGAGYLPFPDGTSLTRSKYRSM